eukprot:118027-Rhodomonas_salina.3
MHAAREVPDLLRVEAAALVDRRREHVTVPHLPAPHIPTRQPGASWGARNVRQAAALTSMRVPVLPTSRLSSQPLIPPGIARGNTPHPQPQTCQAQT